MIEKYDDVALWHFRGGLLQALLLQLVQHGFEARPLCGLPRRRAGQVGLAGAEHAGHALYYKYALL